METKAILKDNVFLELFNDFYFKLLALKDKVEKASSITDKKARQIQDEVSQVMDKQAEDVSLNSGAFLYENYREVQYAMCGFADDMFLKLNWEGKSWWENNLLESKYFKSHIAGDKVFENIDFIIKQKGAFSVSVSSVYLYVLSLGFSGKYNIATDKRNEIEQYKRKLFHLIHSKDAGHVKTYNHLFPDILKYNMSEGMLLERQKIKFWTRALIIIVGSYIGLNFLMWNYSVWGINSAALNISRTIQNAKLK